MLTLYRSLWQSIQLVVIVAVVLSCWWVVFAMLAGISMLNIPTLALATLFVVATIRFFVFGRTNLIQYE